MGFLDDIKWVEKKSNKTSKTTKELLIEGIAKNDDFLKGNAQGSKAGAKFGSWWTAEKEGDPKDEFRVKVGVAKFFEKNISMQAQSRARMLLKFKQALIAGELDTSIQEFEQRREEAKKQNLKKNTK